MKITRNTTKEQLKNLLKHNYVEVKKQDKALADSIEYASKQEKENPKLVKKADLVDLVQQVATLLGDKFIEVTTAKIPQPVVENSVKPKLNTGKGKKEKAEPESEEEKAEEEEKPADSKKQKSSADKKKPANKKNPSPEVVGADSFPNELDMGDTKYAIAHDITDMAKLLESFNKDEEIMFAFYWSKAQLKQFNYAQGTLPAPKEGFENNLDLASALYVSEELKVCYSLSMYTESLYQTMPDSFEEIDGVRYNMGIEFQIYRAVK